MFSVSDLNESILVLVSIPVSDNIFQRKYLCVIIKKPEFFIPALVLFSGGGILMTILNTV